MAKRSRLLNIEKKIKEGRGVGEGEDYKPWIVIQDVPSRGRVSRINGIKTHRQHEFMSDLETRYFYIVEYLDNIVDIREQYPLLDLEETMLIAQEQGIKHPREPETQENIVMTTDFVLTQLLSDGTTKIVARTIKPKEELLNKRVLEKFEIERIYWERRNVSWAIVTEGEINKIVAMNIAAIHAYMNLNLIEGIKDLEEREIYQLKIKLVNDILNTNKSIRKTCQEFDEEEGLMRGVGLSLFRHLLIRKELIVDLTQPLDVNNVIKVNLNGNIKIEQELII